MSISVASLRDHLVSSLSTLPNPHDLGLTVLVSEPKRTSSIFPHTPTPPKCYQQEFLIVLSSNLPSKSPSRSNPGNDNQAQPISGNAAAACPSSSTSQQTEKVLVTAISAYLYTFPQPSSSSSSPSSPASSSSILYISKIDSSGYSPTPLPLTRILIVSFLNYFMVTLENIRIQLFARAQNQYLFANSSQSGNKKVLSGSGLCKWWKSVYEETVLAYDSSRKVQTSLKSTKRDIVEKGKGEGEGNKGIEEEVKLHYLLPSYEEVESKNLVGQGKELPNNWKWEYKPPFDTPIITPLSSSSTSSFSTTGSHIKTLPLSLATLIPSLPDDPKTRFLEELVTDYQQQHVNPLKRHTHTRTQPPSSTSNTHDGNSGSSTTRKSKKEKELEEELNDRQNSHLALSKIDKREFWERIGFRQECGGDVTGFFTLEKRSQRQEDNKDKVIRVDDKKSHEGNASSSGTTPLIQAVSSTIPAIASIEKITSLDPESKSIPALTTSTTTAIQDKEIPLPQLDTNQISAPMPSITKKETTSISLLRQEILDRLLTALTNIDFANLVLSLEGTEIWLKQVKSIVIGEIGEENWGNCIATIPKKEGLSGTIGGGVVRKERQEEVVTMLLPRKKKKVN